jgi:hypothetical protein
MMQTRDVNAGRRRVVRTLCAITTVLVSMKAPAADGPPGAAPVPCRPASALPPTVHVPVDLQRHIASMLSLSRTFRDQCRRLEAAPWVRVLIRVDPKLLDRSFRARTRIDWPMAGGLLARVAISPGGSPVEWIAHELEHILEQIEGLDLPALAAQRRGAWMSSDRMYETTRAIAAGRAVVADIHRAPERRGDKLVE